MTAMASEITSPTCVYRLLRSKEISKLRVTYLCEGNSPVTGEFPTQRPSNTENVSIWWRHHAITKISVAVLYTEILIIHRADTMDTRFAPSQWETAWIPHARQSQFQERTWWRVNNDEGQTLSRGCYCELWRYYLCLFRFCQARYPERWFGT